MEIACDIAGEPLQQVQHGAQRATHNDLTPRRASKYLDTCTSGQVTNIRIGNEHPDRLLSYPDTHNLSGYAQPIRETATHLSTHHRSENHQYAQHRARSSHCHAANPTATESGPEPLGSGPPPMLSADNQ